MKNYEGRMVSLCRQHADLAAEIEEKQRQPGADHLVIQKLKREKLRLKDEITRLSVQAAAAIAAE